MKRNGSITLFFSLFLAIFLLLYEAAWNAVRMEGGKVQTEAGIEEGLYSVFAEYDRELFDRYHVLFVNGGYDTGEFLPGNLYRIIEDSVEQSYTPGRSITGIRGGNLWQATVNGGAVTGYTLASDQGGQAFASQAVAYMKDTAVIQGISLLVEELGEQEKQVEALEAQNLLESARTAEKEYQKAVEENERSKDGSGMDHEGEEADADGEGQGTAADGAGEAETEGSVDGTADVEVPADFVNPLDVIRTLRTEGVLGLLLPEGESVSDGDFSATGRLSERDQGSGLGVLVCGDGVSTAADRIWFLEYMMSHLCCYGEEDTGGDVAYQLEYVIAGRDSDEKNLKSVLTRLLAVREAANMAFLVQDADSQAKLHEMALVICAAVGIPALQSVVCLALEAAWAFGESVLDLRSLLMGGEVPLFKTSGSWLLSLENLARLPEIWETGGGDSSAGGLTYREYLRILLAMKSSDWQIEKTMDVVEHVIRTAEGKDGFCMDHCVSYLQVEMEVGCGGHAFTVSRDYGYAC